eukprot:CAMPEP_0119498600 /NCGR_PEP_ID=MMETSP1344-20130328/21301_1 /TAXON_ID=236787 /ORGANISM="Florenciella parvula, Strain CCMP2471" /LENGTH=183 /DNA_ID=CAMNT_0007534497 /DNA_START=158 /DNA_END=706 /DNA_ORIENTATION=+
MSERLYLNKNSLTGALPTELGQLTGMSQDFYLSYNQLCDDLPSEVEWFSSTVAGWSVTTANSFGSCCGWQDYMGDSMTEAGFPDADGTTSVTSIVYDSQGLTGTIPTEFGIMTNINEFNLENNDLGGTIPSQLGLCALDSLGLASNELTGTIPSHLSAYNTLALSGNSLSGTIPTEMGNCGSS